MSNTATVIASRESLIPALATFKGIVKKNNHIQILTHVEMSAGADGVAIVGTDLDLTVTVRLPAELSEGEFKAVLPHDALANIAKAAEKGALMTFDMLDGFASISAGRARSTLQTLSTEDFPDLKFEGTVKALFDLDAREFGAALKRIASCISSEETRYYLNGAFAHCPEDGILRLVTTDGHRLGRVDILASVTRDMPGIIIPAGTVKLLIKQCLAKGASEVITVKINTQKVLFTLGNVEMLSKLIDGTFPDYARVCPDNRGHNTRLVFDREELIAAVNQVSKLSAERGKAMKLSAGDNGLTVSVNNPDCGVISVPLYGQCYGDAIEVGFNASYVLDILKAEASDKVEFRMTDNRSPALIGATDAMDVAFVLMPVRV